jgi:hypothetical protein
MALTVCSYFEKTRIQIQIGGPKKKIMVSLLNPNVPNDSGSSCAP